MEYVSCSFRNNSSRSLMSIQVSSPSPTTTISTSGFPQLSSGSTLTCGPPSTIGQSCTSLIARAVRQACLTCGVLAVMPTRCGRNSCMNSPTGFFSTSASKITTSSPRRSLTAARYASPRWGVVRVSIGRRNLGLIRTTRTLFPPCGSPRGANSRLPKSRRLHPFCDTDPKRFPEDCRCCEITRNRWIYFHVTELYHAANGDPNLYEQLHKNSDGACATLVIAVPRTAWNNAGAHMRAPAGSLVCHCGMSMRDRNSLPAPARPYGFRRCGNCCRNHMR